MALDPSHPFAAAEAALQARIDACCAAHGIPLAPLEPDDEIDPGSYECWSMDWTSGKYHLSVEIGRDGVIHDVLAKVKDLYLPFPDPALNTDADDLEGEFERMVGFEFEPITLDSFQARIDAACDGQGIPRFTASQDPVSGSFTWRAMLGPLAKLDLAVSLTPEDDGTYALVEFESVGPTGPFSTTHGIDWDTQFGETLEDHVFYHADGEGNDYDDDGYEEARAEYEAAEREED